MGILNQQGLEGLFNQAKRASALIQPDLNCVIKEDDVVLEGLFHVLSHDPLQAAFGPLASFDVCLELGNDFPNAEPKMFEVGGAFPHDPDHHVNPDGSCCFGVWEVLKVEQPNMTVGDFLEGPARSYFYGHHHLQKEGYWPFGELKHGKQGLIQEYARLLGCPANPKIVRGLVILMSRKWKRDRHACPCGNGLKLRDCCRYHLDAIPRKFHYKEARPLLDRLQSYDTATR